ncbi:MAG TPA: amidohydrolase family protein [Acidimicrobiia bacterium]|nr:amidohydrolase family protein [Acidimicrobiia bacterium]
MTSPLHVRGVVLPEEEERDLWVVDGRITFERVSGAETVAESGWVVPGLVDAHCHIGLAPDGPTHERDDLLAQARTDSAAGALLIRDAGSPADTRFLDDAPDAPRLIRCGRHIARPKRYSPNTALEVEPEELAEVVFREASGAGGAALGSEDPCGEAHLWVKLVGDWIDRTEGDLAPLWPGDALRAAVGRAHAAGARVAVHVFSEEALPDLIDAGVDSIEHGTGLTEDLVARLAASGAALVPTLINIDNFPGIADSARAKFPVYADRMDRLYGTARARIRAAFEAGVPIYCGTDAGGYVRHGRVADEILALHEAGLPAEAALAAGSWAARRWLGYDGLEEGAAADFVVYEADPRAGLGVLRSPLRIVLRGLILA